MTLKNIRKSFNQSFWLKLNIIEGSEFPDRKLLEDYEENDLVIYRNEKNQITSYCEVGIIKDGKFKGRKIGSGEMEWI